MEVLKHITRCTRAWPSDTGEEKKDARDEPFPTEAQARPIAPRRFYAARLMSILFVKQMMRRKKGTQGKGSLFFALEREAWLIKKARVPIVVGVSRGDQRSVRPDYAWSFESGKNDAKQHNIQLIIHILSYVCCTRSLDTYCKRNYVLRLINANIRV